MSKAGLGDEARRPQQLEELNTREKSKSSSLDPTKLQTQVRFLEDKCNFYWGYRDIILKMCNT
jgi:hypothetical protein